MKSFEVIYNKLFVSVIMIMVETCPVVQQWGSDSSGSLWQTEIGFIGLQKMQTINSLHKMHG